MVRTTFEKSAPPAFSSSPMFSQHARRLGADVAVDELTGGRIERNLTGEEQEVADAERGRVGPDRRRGASAT